MQGWPILYDFRKETRGTQHSRLPLAAALHRDIELCVCFFSLWWRASHKPAVMRELFSRRHVSWCFFPSLVLRAEMWNNKVLRSCISLLAYIETYWKLVSPWIHFCFVVSGDWQNRRCFWFHCSGSISLFLHSSPSKWRLNCGLFLTWFWDHFRYDVSFLGGNTSWCWILQIRHWRICLWWLANFYTWKCV